METVNPATNTGKTPSAIDEVRKKEIQAIIDKHITASEQEKKELKEMFDKFSNGDLKKVLETLKRSIEEAKKQIQQ
jgi:hypothetical protein